jgi:hypothetical protein
VRSQRSFRVVSAPVLIGLVAASGWLFPSHLLEENVGPFPAQVSPAMVDGEGCQPGNGYGLVPDHARQVDPAHVCVVCKIFKGALYVSSRLTVPLFTPAATAALSGGVTPHFSGFCRPSRSPPLTA